MGLSARENGQMKLAEWYDHLESERRNIEYLKKDELVQLLK